MYMGINLLAGGKFPTLNTSQAEYGYKIQAPNCAVVGNYSLDNLAEGAETDKSTRQYSFDYYEPSNENVVDNTEYAKANMFRIYSNIDKSGNWQITSLTAGNSYNNGRAIHAFSYASTDFLLEAAEQYMTLEDGQSFAWRAIYDTDFIQDTVHFFTGEHATDDELAAIKSQMDGIVKELAANLKNGEAADLNSLKGTLTIAGKDVTIAQLHEMRDVSRALTSGMEAATTDGAYSFAKSAMAVAMSELYGNISSNPLAEEFKNGVEHIADRAIDSTKSLWERCMPQYASVPQSGMECVSVFKNLDTSSVDAMQKSIDKALGSFQGIQSKHGVYGAESYYSGIKLKEQFTEWLNLIKTTAS